jgi:hypothetical protein
MNSKALLALMAAAVVIAVTVAASASGQESDPPPGTQETQIESVEQEARQAMGVLDETPTEADAMPEDVADHFDSHARFGMNPDLAQRAMVDTGHSLYVVPANDHVCASLTVGQGATMTCAQTDDIAAGESGPATATLEGGGIAIYGLVPDGVETVTIGTDETATTVIDTDDNAYYTVFAEGTILRNVEYVGPSGPVEFPIYDPALAFED